MRESCGPLILSEYRLYIYNIYTYNAQPSNWLGFEMSRAKQYTDTWWRHQGKVTVASFGVYSKIVSWHKRYTKGSRVGSILGIVIDLCKFVFSLYMIFLQLHSSNCKRMWEIWGNKTTRFTFCDRPGPFHMLFHGYRKVAKHIHTCIK